MLNRQHLQTTLESAGVASWAAAAETAVNERLVENPHGDFATWRDVLSTLPNVTPLPADLTKAWVGAPTLDLSATDIAALRSRLLTLKPWRKGPFRLGPLTIDAEWQSNMKWERVQAAVSPLDGRRVLDVGCGNGYYALRMRGAGAQAVIGLEPMVLYVMQFLAISHFIAPQPIIVLPLRLQEVPAGPAAFDTVFSMGVLYHQRAPIDHLRDLRRLLRPGGELVLETLILPGDSAVSRTPRDRYARMRNVWHLPSLAELTAWLKRVGLAAVTVADVTATTIVEQRATEWMPFESLSEALDPNDPSLTIEGWPAPLRTVVVCRTP